MMTLLPGLTRISSKVEVKKRPDSLKFINDEDGEMDENDIALHGGEDNRSVKPMKMKFLKSLTDEIGWDEDNDVNVEPHIQSTFDSSMDEIKFGLTVFDWLWFC